MSYAELTPWIGVIQIAMGLPSLVMGLRARGRSDEWLAPLGAVFLSLGVSKILRGTVTDGVLMASVGVVVVAGIIWFVRVERRRRRGIDRSI
jgi:hypothetical protein